MTTVFPGAMIRASIRPNVDWRMRRPCMGTRGTGAPMPTDDTWQQRLAFVSGNVLVAGLAMTRLWPLAASYQTGRHTHLWTLFWQVGQMGSDFTVYRYLVILIGFAATVVTLAVIHILGRGLLLATDSMSGVTATYLENLCSWSYKSIFLLLVWWLFWRVSH